MPRGGMMTRGASDTFMACHNEWCSNGLVLEIEVFDTFG